MGIMIRRNERSWAIEMISDINIRLQALTLRIVKLGGEATIQDGHTRMFPDVLLYGDDNQTVILQGWELKLPDTPITDVDFIEDAKRKAIALGVNSFFIWNFKEGVLYIKEDDAFRVKKHWAGITPIATRDDVERYKDQWMPIIEQILIEINEYLNTGEIHATGIDDVISNTAIAYVIERNKVLVGEYLHENCVENTVMDADISAWWRECQSEYILDETNMYNAYAKVILLNWLNRIIFAHIIKPYHMAAYEVNDLTRDSTVEDGNEVFDRITEQCDFYTIFCGIRYNKNLPNGTWRDLMDINMFLKENRIESINHEVLQNILEKTIASTKRESIGQFTTPQELADILVRITTLNWREEALDPCCGSGTIAKAILENKIKKLNNLESAKASVWAADKFSFPLQIANLSMTDGDSMNLLNKVFKKNVFDLHVQDVIYITSPETGIPTPFDIPKFGAIISNLPFVPFEKIKEDKCYIDAIVEEVKETTGIQLGRRNDYYIYILFSLQKLLKEDGRLGVIISNSWLGTAVGKEFFNALRFYYKVEQVHISCKSKWFHNADVITTILILSKRTTVEAFSGIEQTAFCAWKKSLEEISENEQLAEELVQSSLLNREINSDLITITQYTQDEIARIIHMNVSLNTLFYDVTWLMDIKELLVPISTVFKVIRGERRGWDKMFFPESRHGIESCYIKKVLKSARNVTKLTTVANSDAFCCSKSKQELEELNHNGALTWIEKFENTTNKVGKPLADALARSGMYWYEMRTDAIADIVTAMNPGGRLFYSRLEESSFINQRLIGLQKTEEYPDLELNHSLLNSIIGMFYIEAVGFARGLGALDITADAISNALMLDPNAISQEQRERIIEKFDCIKNREVLSTELELQMEDRENFDLEVLRAYGIEEYYSRIKTTLLEMQGARIKI